MVVALEPAPLYKNDYMKMILGTPKTKLHDTTVNVNRLMVFSHTEKMGINQETIFARLRQKIEDAFPRAKIPTLAEWFEG